MKLQPVRRVFVLISVVTDDQAVDFVRGWLSTYIVSRTNATIFDCGIYLGAANPLDGRR